MCLLFVFMFWFLWVFFDDTLYLVLGACFWLVIYFCKVYDVWGKVSVVSLVNCRLLLDGLVCVW